MPTERIPSFSILTLTVLEIWPSKVWVSRTLFRSVNFTHNLQAYLDIHIFGLKTDTCLKIAMSRQYDPVYQILNLVMAYIDYFGRD